MPIDDVFLPTAADLPLSQGDVISEVHFGAIESDVWAITMSPECDLWNQKSSYVLFAAYVHFETVVKKLIANDLSLADMEEGKIPSQGKLKHARRRIRDNILGDFLPRYYFLPEYVSADGEAIIVPKGYVDFQSVFVIPYLDCVDTVVPNRVGRVASPWREQLITRFSGYNMRIGTPDYPETLLDQILGDAGWQLPD